MTIERKRRKEFDFVKTGLSTVVFYHNTCKAKPRKADLTNTTTIKFEKPAEVQTHG